jgi:hypothetical protein
VAGTSPESMCVGGWRTPMQNRDSGVAARRPRLQFRAAVVIFNLKSNLNPFKIDSNHSNFDRLNNGLPELNHFELKCDFEDLRKLNNFLHRIFF